MLNEIEHQLLESAKRAHGQGNDIWELDVLRIHALIRKAEETKQAESVPQPIGSERFELITDPEKNTGIFQFNSRLIPLSKTETALMGLLISTPNTVIDLEQVISTTYERRATTRAFQVLAQRLNTRLGENTILVTGNRVVFLPNQLGVGSKV